MEPSTSTTGTPLPPPPPLRPPVARITRSRDDRVLAGVCGGIADHLRIDPVLVRIAVVVAAFAGGAGIVAYGAAWLLLPQDDGGRSGGLPSRRRRGLTAVVAGLLIVLVLSRVLWDRDGDLAFGALLIIGGGLVLWRRRDDRLPADPPDRPVGTWSTQRPPTGPDVWSQPSSPAVAAGTATIPPPPPAGRSAHPVVDDERAPLALRVLGWLVITGVCTGIGVLRFIEWSRVSEGWPAGWTLVLAGLATGGLAVALVRKAPTGTVGAGLGLVAVAVVLVAATTDLRGSVGEWERRPTTIPAAGFQVRHALGSSQLDLTALETTPGQAVAVAIDAGAGDIEVIVPADATVVVDVALRAGEITLFGRTTDGWDIAEQATDRGPEGGPVVTITGQAGVGAFEVRRAAA